MTAPTLSSRGVPRGLKMEEGFSTKISLNYDVTIDFWEKTVKPPPVDGGEPIDTTTMHNTAVHTMAPRSLYKYDVIDTKVAWKPGTYASIISRINQRDSITIHFPEASTLTFYGYLQKFDPDALEEGKLPEATIAIVVTNEDPTTGLEVLPVLVSAGGT